MALTLRKQMATTLLLICSLAVNGVSWSPRQLGDKMEAPAHGVCPPCELLFTKLEDTGANGKLSQVVNVQERGEPKSGTGVMYFWAIATFMKTCEYLRELYGEEACWCKWGASQGQERHRNDRPGIETDHLSDVIYLVVNV